MNFGDKWKQISDLPNTAMQQIPDILSENTKMKLAEKTPAEISAIVTAAIDDINHGSVDTVDTLVRKRL